jgi:phage terminase large subunit
MYVREVYDNYTGQMRHSYGFQTNSTSRPVLIARMVEFMRDHVQLIHDRDTLGECLTFIRNDRGRAEAEQGEHDDLVMAYGIALMARAQQKMTATEGEERKQTRWTKDMWADWRRADAEEKARMKEKWGDPM